ncbi:MAG: PDZ domain-containing protein [Gemmatimonadaceae bacterium]|jgi:S1-C subfamily serine protease|nr:PDZ domain-containing protein [Gemmatimonadaceae bacterium]
MVLTPFLALRARHARLVIAAVGAATVLPVIAAPPCDAQQSTERPARERRVEITRNGPYAISISRGDDQRAVLGIGIGSSSRRDTLGVAVDEVTADGPAAKAGIPEGARLTAINGVSLRISADDADDPELRGLGERRLRRELAKVRPGDDVELKVLADGVTKTMRVKTVAAEELVATPVRRMRESLETRPYLGLGVGTSGSVRDTLGLFVSSVTDGGPAEKAGIVEGDRIQSINGVDVRVPREDAGDWSTSSARANRFTRTLRAAKPGDVISLEVISGGRTRSVKVTAGKASDFSGQRRGFQMQLGDDFMFWGDPDRDAPRAFSPGSSIGGRIERIGDDVQLELDGLRIDAEQVGRQIRQAVEQAARSMPRVRFSREPGSYTIEGGTRLRRISL